MPSERSDDWTCRFFRDGDEQGILDVLLATFGRWPTAELTVPPIDHLHWKLRSDDLALRSHAVVELHGRIIACHVTISQHVKVGLRVLTTCHGVDAATLPEFQARGAGRDLRRFNAEARPKHYDLYFGIQSDHAAMPNLRKQDWTGARLVRRGEILVADAPLAGGADGSSCTLREVTQFDDRVDGFALEASAPFQRITMRTKDELNWRYCDRRAGPFRVVLAEERDELIGYVVFRISYERGYIADLLALPGRLDAAASLIRHAIAGLRAAGASEIECWSTPGHPYHQVLADAGFSRIRRKTTIVHKSVRAPDEWLSCLKDDRATVNVMAGDTDLI